MGATPQPSNTRARIIALGLPIITFISGMLVQLFVQDLWSDRFSTPEIVTLAAVLGAVLVLFCLAVLVAVDYRERTIERGFVSASLEEITRKFGISVEFIPDGDHKAMGLTYSRTRELVERARKSLVFVDFWVATGDYLEGKPDAKGNREKYYESIVAGIVANGNRAGEGPFHRRIVQMPEISIDGSRFTLSKDPNFCQYLRRCLELQEDGHHSTIVKIAPAYVHTHFAIIDARYVVLPILTSHPKRGGLRRHGALVFDDTHGEFVNQLMAIYDLIDAVASPLEELHLTNMKTQTE